MCDAFDSTNPIGEKMSIKKGDTVKVHYRGTLEDGTEFDSSSGREPMEFTIGKRTLIRGFEKSVIGHKAGDKYNIRIPPEEAYGKRNESLVFTIKLAELPEGMECKKGQQVKMQLDKGQVLNAVVCEITDSEVIFDGNFHLAGKTLIFDIEVVELC
jgi:peptidylprolyl isomerase